MLEQMKTEFNPFTTRVLLCFTFLRRQKRRHRPNSKDSIETLRATWATLQHGEKCKAARGCRRDKTVKQKLSRVRMWALFKKLAIFWISNIEFKINARGLLMQVLFDLKIAFTLIKRFQQWLFIEANAC